MMGRKSNQIQLIMLDMETLIPEKHLLKKISEQVDFSFIYELAEPYYSSKGRPSIDPICLIKMLLIGYLYGIRSERRLEEEISLNIAYRWFCGFDLMDQIPDHSIFSQNRRRRFTDDGIFRKIFNKIVIMCIEQGLVSGDKVVCDGSFIPVNVDGSNEVKITTEVEKSTVSYLAALDEELKEIKGYVEPTSQVITKQISKNKTDLEGGYINQERKKGYGYLAEVSVDTDNGIITGVSCYPANQMESVIVLEHFKQQMEDTGLKVKSVGLDAGYDVGAVHRGFEILGINGYVSIREHHNNTMANGYQYIPEEDYFLCKEGQKLEFIRLAYKKSSGYYRLYRIHRSKCRTCKYFRECEAKYRSIRINASPFYPAYYANRQRYKSPEYKTMARLRNIWSEGTFAALKNNHNLKKIRKRGIQRASEECLLSALALNLKRMAKAA